MFRGSVIGTILMNIKHYLVYRFVWMYIRGQWLPKKATNINKDRTSLRKLECVLNSSFMIKANNLAEAPEGLFRF